MIAYIIIGLVGLQKVTEVFYAAHNTAALKQRGGIEIGWTHYPLIVLPHVAWQAAIVVSLPRDGHINWLPLRIFILLQFARVWVIAKSPSLLDNTHHNAEGRAEQRIGILIAAGANQIRVPFCSKALIFRQQGRCPAPEARPL